MKILGHIHTFNEEVDRSLQALLDQTYPVNEILVVDNGSTDSILEKPFPKHITVVRNSTNLGPSGALVGSLQYAMAKQYDWIWVFDADSAPRKDALEKLVDLYASFNLQTQHDIGVLSCSQVLEPSTKLFQGRRLTPSGPRLSKIDPSRPYCECDATIWSGSLINIDAVRAVGLPRCGRANYWEDMSCDQGDVDFFYRIKKAGYRVLVHRFSMIDHLVGQSKQVHILGRTFVSTNHSPDRRYLFFRNLTYFWLYLYPRRNWLGLSLWFSYRFTLTILGIVIIEKDRVPKLWACLRGIRDGLTKNLYRHY